MRFYSNKICPVPFCVLAAPSPTMKSVWQTYEALRGPHVFIKNLQRLIWGSEIAGGYMEGSHDNGGTAHRDGRQPGHTGLGSKAASVNSPQTSPCASSKGPGPAAFVTAQLHSTRAPPSSSASGTRDSGPAPSRCPLVHEWRAASQDLALLSLAL